MFIIAEIGINHDGDVEQAKQLIALAQGCGADAVKFQKRTVGVVYHKKFLDSPRDSKWGRTQRDQKKGLEFGWQEYDKINQHCRQLNIPWFASAWDLEALHFIDAYNPIYHKVAGAMITNLDFLQSVAKLKKKTFISTAMCELSDVISAVDIFKSYRTPIVLMHCVGLYPCPIPKLNLLMIPFFKSKFPGVEVGYSGHEKDTWPSEQAMVLGAEYIERHVTLDHSLKGSDHAASLEPQGLSRLVYIARNTKAAMGDGKKAFGEAEHEVAKKLRYWEK